MADIACNIGVRIEYDSESHSVSQVILELPDRDAYQQVSGVPLCETDWLRLFDWSWGELEFESRLRSSSEFEVLGRFEDDRESQVIRVVTDTPMHALARANAEMSDDDREFTALLVLFDGEIVAMANQH